MRRALISRILLSMLALFVLAALNLWGWRPFVDPDPVENGDGDEIHLAAQRISEQPLPSVKVAPLPSKFGGNPYLVGSPVTTTTTLPEAETNIAVNPANPSTLVGIITD